MSIKIAYDKEIHSGQVKTYSELLQYIQRSFKSLPAKFSLFYLDAENDQITLSCEEDFVALLEYQKQPKIFIQAVGEAAQQQIVVAPAVVEAPKPLNYWECEKCTFFNSLQAEQCEMCNTKRPVVRAAEEKQPVPKPQLSEPVHAPRGDAVEMDVAQQASQKEERKSDVPVPAVIAPPVQVQDLLPPRVESVEPLKRPEMTLVPRTQVVQQQQQQSAPKEQEEQAPFVHEKVIEQKKKKLVKNSDKQKLKKKSHKEEKVRNLVKEELQKMLPEMLQQSLLSSQALPADASRLSSVTGVAQSGVLAAVHANVQCDGCGVHPITGARYKCTVCPNFDYCERCEAQREHPHAFYKIRRPEQAQSVLHLSQIVDDAASFIRDAPPVNSSHVNQNDVSSSSRSGVVRKAEHQHVFEDLQQKSNTSASQNAQPAGEENALAKSIIVNSPLPQQQQQQQEDPFKNVSQQVREMCLKVGEILGGRPEEYIEAVNNLPGADLDQVTRTILNEQSYYQKAKPVGKQ